MCVCVCVCMCVRACVCVRERVCERVCVCVSLVGFMARRALRLPAPGRGGEGVLGGGSAPRRGVCLNILSSYFPWCSVRTTGPRLMGAAAGSGTPAMSAPPKRLPPPERLVVRWSGGGRLCCCGRRGASGPAMDPLLTTFLLLLRSGLRSRKE